jgi:RNA polymerase sigma factor (sigma-70 family)
MVKMGQHTERIASDLARLRNGDARAINDLLDHAANRLMHLTRKMLHGFGSVKRWEQTDDVYQNACMRLARALGDQTPSDPRHFYRLAAVQIRRELIDMARRYRGPLGLGANHATILGVSSDKGEDTPSNPLDVGGQTHDPRKLHDWTELHEHVATLPEKERECVDLLLYNGLTQREAADLMGVDERTIKRYWQKARLQLHKLLGSGSAVFDEAASEAK